MVDLADNLGSHLDQTVHISVCCGGLVVTGKLIGAQEYFDGMRGVVLQGASELMPKYRKEAEELFGKLLPDTERLPERREEWDEFYEPDPYRDAPDYIHLAEATFQNNGELIQVRFWRGRLSAVSSFWATGVLFYFPVCHQ
jgi:hypothetical protein